MERKKQDFSNETQLASSTAARILYLGLGITCLALGALGAILPILPTTPFMLLAAGCFAKSSTRFYNWLLNNPLFGPMIQQWRQYRSISPRTKAMASLLIVITLGTSIIFFVGNFYLRILLIFIGAGVITFLLRIPSRKYPSPLEENPLPL